MEISKIVNVGLWFFSCPLQHKGVKMSENSVTSLHFNCSTLFFFSQSSFS